MTREEAVQELKVQQQNDDTESAHSNADDVLCALRRALGYNDVVAEYHKVNKWYA